MSNLWLPPEYGNYSGYNNYYGDRNLLYYPVDYRVVSTMKAVNYLAQKFNLLTEQLLDAHLKFNQLLVGGAYEHEIFQKLGELDYDTWIRPYVKAGKYALSESIGLLKRIGNDIYDYRGRLEALERDLLGELTRFGYDVTPLEDVLSEIRYQYSDVSNLFYRSAYWGAKAQFLEDAVIILSGHLGVL